MAQVEIYPTKAELVEAAAVKIVEAAKTAVGAQGRFSLALAGGSTPAGVYRLLAGKDLDWEKVHLFWGDERCVPPDHPVSNFRMARQSLLDHIAIPPENVHRIQGELPPKQAAIYYQRDLERFFSAGQSFDLVLLGMGADGHTASLFPGSPALGAKWRWAVEVKHNRPPEPLVDRVSLTFPAINAARQVIILVAGAGKAESLKEALAISPDANPIYPVQYVRPYNCALLWLLDQDAAGEWQAQR